MAGAKAGAKPGARGGSKGRKQDGLTYRGHPLRRAGNLIYYGSMKDKYIIMMQIQDAAPSPAVEADKSGEKPADLNVATRVSIQLQLTDPDLKSRDRVVKKGEKDSLYSAMDFATVWLERALAGKQ